MSQRTKICNMFNNFFGAAFHFKYGGGTAAIVLSAFARLAVSPVQPPVVNADTETATNVAFAAWERGLGEFRLDIEFTGTASNNVEVAFGTDVDGNGESSCLYLVR